MYGFTFFTKAIPSLLLCSKASGTLVKFPSPLSDNEYDSIKPIMEMCHGHWRESDQGFFFQESSASTMKLLEAVNEDSLASYIKANKFKEDNQFFETPDSIAERMVDTLTHTLLQTPANGSFYRFLEPSAGCGNLVEKLVRRMHDLEKDFRLDAVEPEPENYRRLVELVRDLCEEDRIETYRKTMETFTNDMLLDVGIPSYDAVLLNPPFGGVLGPKHVMTAYNLLAPGGVLVALVSSNSILYNNHVCNSFDLFLDTHGARREPLPYGCFKDSGTMVDITMITMRKL